MEQVLNYIKENLSKTFREPNSFTPYPFVSPTIDEQYKDFYYWDTYFENLGLMLLGKTDYVESNLDNIAYAINKYGFMPNALVHHSLNRSQPPFFTKMVYGYYKFTDDKRIIQKYIDAIITEHSFWKRKRTYPVGLSSYGCESEGEDLISSGYCHHERVQESSDTVEGRMEIGKNLLAIAESGLDFNMRFKTDESNISADRFYHLDLNCILYEAEVLTAEMLDIIGRIDEAKEYTLRAKVRKDAVNKYLWCEEKGVYLDYDFIDGRFSSVLSAVSLYPFAFGVSTDANSAKRVLGKLELDYGVSACEFRGDNALYYQWDYPCVWPAATLLSYQALVRAGLSDDALRIAEKYLKVVDKNFILTGRLWEKYDGRTGDIAVTTEYVTPPFLGWTASNYVVLNDRINKGKSMNV